MNKVAVISGASGGLGKELCLAFGKKGYKIWALDVNELALQEFSINLNKEGISNITSVVDISNIDACKTLFTSFDPSINKIEVLINNAGVTDISLFSPDSHIEITKKVMAVNFWGSINLTSVFWESLIKNKGTIINLSSVAGFAPLMGRTAYSASKYALHGFFESLRTENENVHVMMVCPSFINTSIGKDKKKHLKEKQLSADFVANKIFHAFLKKKRLLLIGKTAFLAYYVNKLFPRFYEKKMIKSQEALFNL